MCNKPANGYRWPETTFWDADKNGGKKVGSTFTENNMNVQKIVFENSRTSKRAKDDVSDDESRIKRKPD